MRFAIAQSAAYQRARAGRIARVEHVHVERNTIAAASLLRNLDRLINTGVQSTFINLAHRKESNAQRPDQITFARIDVAPAHMRTVFGIKLRSKTADVHKFGRAVTEQGGQRHSVNIPRWRSL